MHCAGNIWMLYALCRQYLLVERWRTAGRLAKQKSEEGESSSQHLKSCLHESSPHLRSCLNESSHHLNQSCLYWPTLVGGDQHKHLNQLIMVMLYCPRCDPATTETWEQFLIFPEGTTSNRQVGRVIYSLGNRKANAPIENVDKNPFSCRPSWALSLVVFCLVSQFSRFCLGAIYPHNWNS